MSDAATAAAPTPDALGPLPEWNLLDLYAGPDAPALAADLKGAETDAVAFRDRYQGKLAGLDGAALGAAIAAYEKIDETLARVMSYASLVYAGDMADAAIARFYQTMQERVTAISTNLLFFTLELNRIDDKVLAKQLETPAARRYAPWLRDVRVFRPHQLADDMERLLHEKHVAGRAAWNRLFDETVAALRFPVDGKDLTSAEALHLLSDADRGKRQRAAASVGRVFGDNIRLFALITNTLAKDKEIEDKWRDYKRPVSSRNLANHVEDEVVDALVAAVKAAYPDLAHRYYAMKARWLGLDKLEYWDRNAPLPDDDDRIVPWPDAERTVLEAYRAFSPAMAEVGRRFFERRWIDAPVRPGKSPGAFA
ncbi:MAG TPA: oligoendopeptidase F, partial [Alphaproteobacteria bacterium]|nr:oligoendopeptidase F [Alphaproteobacteria bacterium]